MGRDVDIIGDFALFVTRCGSERDAFFMVKCYWEGSGGGVLPPSGSGRAWSQGEEGQGEERKGCLLARVSPSAVTPRDPCTSELHPPTVASTRVDFVSLHSVARTLHGSPCHICGKNE